MYRLLVCTISWLVLLVSLVIAWTRLPQPRTTSDIVVIVVIAAAAVAFARLGLVSLVALLLRMLPSGRVRTALAVFAVRAMPRLLASSVLTVVSASLVVQAAHAVPMREGRAGPISHPPGAETMAAAPIDPGWPTVQPPPTEASEDEAHTTETDETAGRDSANADEKQMRDPAWPSPQAPRHAIHEVAGGESLWSIGAEFADGSEDIPDLVDEIYSANRETIGPDPSLIIAGQRLEIQP
ncbi:LysM peptidoglycan-binding domain-containing protein [Brevibacterium renqingii]|uniref:LysM peptidoglycan-binding domain-containing protein n=1 Tax=Brevibacterium renqingii TaxID=2776916 RepID=UPI001AE01E12|nr:LysM peptidoglycan-binding domain-containing protein [Brevibacterium renqingii]